MILKNSQSGGGLQLLIIQCQEVGLCFLDLEEHLLSQVLGSLNLLSFHVANLELLVLLLIFQVIFQLSNMCLKRLSIVIEIINLLDMLLQHNP